jgi:hypothetical protein
MISALDGGEWSASRPGRFIPGEINLGSHCIGGWVGPGEKKILPLPGIEPRHYTDWPIPAPTAWLDQTRSQTRLVGEPAREWHWQNGGPLVVNHWYAFIKKTSSTSAVYAPCNCTHLQLLFYVTRSKRGREEDDAVDYRSPWQRLHF